MTSEVRQALGGPNGVNKMQSSIKFARTRSTNAQFLVVLLIVLVLVILTRRPSFFRDHFDLDEGLYFTVATRLLSGDFLYKDIWDNKPVGIYIIYVGAVSLFGKSLFAINLTSLLAVFVTSFTLLCTGIRGVNQRAAAIAAIVFPFYMLDLGAQGANAENFFIVFDTFSAFVLLTLLNLNDRPKYYSLAAGLFGLSQGLAFQIKFLSMFETGAMLVVFAAIVLIDCRRLLGLVRPMSVFIVAFSIPTLCALAVFAIAGHLYDAVFAMFIVPRLYVQDPFGIARGWPTVEIIIRRLSYFAPMMILGAAVVIGAAIGKLRLANREWESLCLIGAWLIGAILGAVSTGLFAYHYFVAVAPAACLFGGWALDRLLRRFDLRGAIAITMATACIVLWPLQSMVRKEIVRYRAPPAMTSEMLAAEITRYVPPQARIFATDQNPFVYGLSETIPATRYPFPYHIFDRAEFYGVKPLDEIQNTFASAPALVIGSRRLLLGGNGAIGKLLQRELQAYHQVPTRKEIEESGVVFFCRTAQPEHPASGCR